MGGVVGNVFCLGAPCCPHGCERETADRKAELCLPLSAGGTLLGFPSLAEASCSVYRGLVVPPMEAQGLNHPPVPPLRPCTRGCCAWKALPSTVCTHLRGCRSLAPSHQHLCGADGVSRRRSSRLDGVGKGKHLLGVGDDTLGKPSHLPVWEISQEEKLKSTP